MKTKAWCLEIDGDLCPTWMQTDRKILRYEAAALMHPHGTAKIRRVNVTVTKAKRKKKQ